MFAWLELLYYGMTGFGFITTGLSMIMGGGDDAQIDTDVDAHLDLDHDHDLDLGSDVGHEIAQADGSSFMSMPIASIRFWMFFANTFGLTGVGLSLVGLAPQWVFGIASAVGSLGGYVGFRVFRHLQRESVSGETQLTSFRGSEARVLLPIRPGARGKVVIERLADRVEMIAHSEHDGEIPVRSTVVIVAVRDGIAEVAPLTE